MSYVTKQNNIVSIGAGIAKVTTGTGDAAPVYRVFTQIRVTRIMASVTTAIVNGLVAAIVTVYRRPTPGSTSGQVAIGTLTFPTGTALGKVLYKDIVETNLFPGEELAFNVSTAGTDSGSAAGAFVGSFEANDDPDTPANQSNMVASA